MKAVLLICLLWGGVICHAQVAESAQKIGHADWEYIFNNLPDYKKIEAELKAYDLQLQNQLAAKAKEIEFKYKAYQELPENTPEAIKRDKANELTYLQETMERFRQDAQGSMQKKESELVNPLLVKIGKAINEVALENGYAYILNPHHMNGNEFVLFADEKNNISNLVLKKLGIDPVKPQTSTPKRY